MGPWLKKAKPQVMPSRKRRPIMVDVEDVVSFRVSLGLECLKRQICCMKTKKVKMNTSV